MRCLRSTGEGPALVSFSLDSRLPGTAEGFKWHFFDVSAVVDGFGGVSEEVEGGRGVRQAGYSCVEEHRGDS